MPDSFKVEDIGQLGELREVNKGERITIEAPNFARATIRIRGTADYVQNKFSAKARDMIEQTQREGSRSRKGKKKEARNFEADFEAAKHISDEGWLGIPAPAFRNAMIDACRMAGFAMTRARMSVFVEPEGRDKDDGTPLVRISGDPVMPAPEPVRNQSGVVDLRCRPHWPAWEVVLTLKWDADQFSASDIVNLLTRAGIQVGIGEGRPFSKNSNGQGWGTFEVVNQ